MTAHKHIISMLVEDEPGVMTRISGLFARRGFNINTITVGKTQVPNVSKIVITVKGDDRTIEQIEKQVNKLVDVFKVIEMKDDESVTRELCLVKVSLSSDKAKTDIMRYAQVYKAPIVDITPKSATIQLVGKPQKNDAFLELMKPFGIKDISRTGTTAIHRGGNGEK